MSAPTAHSVPAELYRDPIYDGATDPTVVIAADGTWWMFYTQRRATHPEPGPGVAWVHGSRIGVARSRDGLAWRYAGTLEPDVAGLALEPGPPPADVEVTHWAPEVVHDGERWRMYLTEIDGVPDRWPGFARSIVEYVSDDLARWECRGPIPLASDRVIDAAVARTGDGRHRLWYKDEADDSTTWSAVSDDLSTWSVEGRVVDGDPHEGPNVFELGGWFWMLTDEWRGLRVLRSVDGLSWERRGLILDAPGRHPLDRQVGRHADVVVRGEDAVVFYFTHPFWDGGEIADAAGAEARISAIHVARVWVDDDELLCDRDPERPVLLP